MSQREILAIAIKVFSLWFLCQLFIQVTSFIPMLAGMASWQGTQIPTWAYFAICASFLISGFIIVRLLFVISNSALKSMSSEKDIEVSDQSQRFVLQIVGLFFTVSSIIWLPNSLASLLTQDSPSHYLGYAMRPFGYFMQLVIGLWLAIHPSWWVAIFNKFRGRA